MTPVGARPARTADVVIVGGGVTGCSIAFHLAEQGVRDVLVLERRFLAAGGTGRSVGVMRQLYPTDASSRMVLHSLRVFQSFRETPVRGLYVAAGMSGHGFKLSPAVGRMMADLITRGRSDLADLRPFRLDRFAATLHDDGGAFSHSYLR